MNKHKNSNLVLALLLAIVFTFAGCSSDNTGYKENTPTTTIEQSETLITDDTNTTEVEEPSESPELIVPQQEKSVIDDNTAPQNTSNVNVPAYSGRAYVEINNNIPYFTAAELSSSSFETYSSLDNLGRCGVVTASVGRDIMPTEERDSIGQVKPSGWHTIKYENVDGKYLYNRCHLIGYQLTGENANTRNLITGTRFLNIEGMLPFENMVADYVKETGNHVMYRVTPIFSGNNLLADGVLMEGYSVEDNGDGICYNVFCYNVQPGITIDYATGDSSSEAGPIVPEQKSQPQNSSQNANTGNTNYIANKNTKKKLHYPSCSSVDQMKESNKEYLSCTREEALSRGYDPCQRCIGK